MSLVRILRYVYVRKVVYPGNMVGEYSRRWDKTMERMVEVGALVAALVTKSHNEVVKVR